MTRTALESFAQFSRSSRTVLVGLVVLVALIVFVAALPNGPLASAIERKRDDVARKSQLLLSARKHVTESQALTDAARPQRSRDPRAAVDKVFAAVGVQASRGSGANDDGQASIVIGNASFDDLVRAIDTLARDEAIHVVDGTITRLVDRGRVRADLVFAR